MFEPHFGPAMPGSRPAAAPFPRVGPSDEQPAARLLREFLRFAGWRRLLAALALILLGVVLEGVGILILLEMARSLLVADASGAAPSDLSPLAGDFVGSISSGTQRAFALVLIATAVLLRGAALTARDSLLARLQHGFVQRVKLDLLGGLAKARWADLVRQDRSVLLQMLGSEMIQLASAVHHGLAICVASIFLIGMSGLAVYLAPALYAFVALFLAATFLASRLFLARSGSAGQRLLDEDMVMGQAALRFLDILKLAKTHGRQHAFLERYSQASTHAVQQRVAFVRLLSASRNALVAALLLTAVAALMLGSLVLGTPVLELMAFVVILSRLAGPALAVQQGLQQIVNGVPRFALARKLAASLDRPEEAVPPTTLARAPRRGAVVEFDRVGFDRGGRSGSLRDITFAARAGDVLGLCGPSGAGKTTLLDLACGLLAPTAGVVRIDGSERRSPPSFDGIYLSHEPGLYAGSLRDNMLWFAPGKGNSDFREALLKMGAGPLLARLEEGLDTWLIDGGGNISAGERQRVALARAILRDPPLILLDEATASLDRASEASILAALRELPIRPTIILVSHRSEVLEACDRVIELADGSLLDQRFGSRLQASA